MRDIALAGHIALGVLVVILPLVVLYLLRKKSPLTKPLSALTAAVTWVLLIPAGILYVNFYPATRTLIQAGSSPWLHSILMETKEHWGILLPLVATAGAIMVFSGKEKESRKWWISLAIISIALAVMGRAIKLGAVA